MGPNLAITVILAKMEERSRYVLDADESTFASEVIERSHETPVVVDFWAEWCAPCRALGPVLERLAEEGAGSWLLAKVDTDRNPNLATAAGVMGIPAVRAFKDGRVVDEFTGAIPEAQVRAWLKKFVPNRGEQLAQDGLDAESRGDLASAEADFTKALEVDPTNETATRGLKRLAILGTSGRAESELAAAIERNPEDVEVASELARARLARGAEDFYSPLIDIIRRQNGESRESARRRLLEIVDLLPPGDPRALSARKTLAATLF